ncbi:hypothetical protein D3C87_2133660 [compost metagenome]
MEYLEEGNIFELADIVEIVYGILNSMNISIEDFEEIRRIKAKDRGGFKEKIFLENVE